MQTVEIVKALRCTSTEGNVAPDCKGCPFWVKERLDPEWAAKVGTDERDSCDCNAVGFAAADRLEELLERCAQYAEEIAVLRERQKKVEQPGGCAFAPWCGAVREAREKAESIMTNADCIRAMSDELLAEFLDTTQKMECEAFHAINSDGTLRFESLKNGWLEWLQLPAEGVE